MAQSDWWDQLDDMQRQMERFLQHSANKRRPVMFSAAAWQPLVDVYETRDEVVVVAELAGVHREDVRIVLQDNALFLAGERRDPRAGKPRTYKVMEVNFGHFERQIPLPAAVIPGSANANLENGFLVITLAKAPEPTVQHVNVMIGNEAEEHRGER